jgi:RNA-directed DNA polymerase
MGSKRQNIQLTLAFMTEGRGEAPSPGRGGTELPMVDGGPESLAVSDRLMEEVCEGENVKKAVKRVQKNGGSPGIDGMSVEALPGYLRGYWPVIRDQLLSGSYRPQPVKRAAIPKAGGGVRKLGTPTVVDRFIQQMLLQVLQRRWDRTFSESSYGFRPGRSAHQAVAKAQAVIAQGYRWVVDIDLEQFFDRVNHDILMGRVAKRVRDKRVLTMIRAFLNAGVMENGLVSPVDEGTPQGGPLSPLLSNLVLDDLDKELERRGHRYVRYADDSNIYVRSERAGQRVMEGISRFITKTLKLRVNKAKSAVAPVGTRKFLGFSFMGGEEPRRRIAPQALNRFKARVRKLTRRTRGVGVEQMVEQVARYLVGWRGYFAYCETPTVLERLDSWIRRRLRCVVWKQWKKGRRRFAELRKRGVGIHLAACAAGSAHGPWRLSQSRALNVALPTTSFDALGLPRLANRMTA